MHPDLGMGRRPLSQTQRRRVSSEPTRCPGAVQGLLPVSTPEASPGGGAKPPCVSPSPPRRQPWGRCQASPCPPPTQAHVLGAAQPPRSLIPTLPVLGLGPAPSSLLSHIREIKIRSNENTGQSCSCSACTAGRQPLGRLCPGAGEALMEPPTPSRTCPGHLGSPSRAAAHLPVLAP